MLYSPGRDEVPPSEKAWHKKVGENYQPSKIKNKKAHAVTEAGLAGALAGALAGLKSARAESAKPSGTLLHKTPAPATFSRMCVYSVT